MGYTLRQVETERKFCQSLTVEALERAVPLETIKSVLQQQGVQAQRERKLNMVVTVWVVIAMNLFAHLSIGHVMRKLARGLRFVWPDPSYRLPKAHPSRIGAISWALGLWWRCSGSCVGPWPRLKP